MCRVWVLLLNRDDRFTALAGVKVKDVVAKVIRGVRGVADVFSFFEILRVRMA